MAGPSGRRSRGRRAVVRARDSSGGSHHATGSPHGPPPKNAAGIGPNKIATGRAPPHNGGVLPRTRTRRRCRMGLFDKLRGEFVDIVEWTEPSGSELLA